MSMSLPDRTPSKLRREPSPELVKAQVRQVIKRILEEIQSAMRLPEKPEKAYICIYDLERIWSDKSRISTLLQPNQLSQDQIAFVQTRMIIILSTLVYVGATDCLFSFCSRFFHPVTGQALFTDADFPFEEGKLSFLDSEPALQQQFYDNVFRFKPVLIEIEPRQTTQKVHPKQRLPFESRVKDVGAGGYGKVDCVGISPYYIKLESGFTAPHVHKVACKKIIVRKDFDQEKQNLQILKESLTSHHRIMKHLTTIEHGDNRYILLPYAAYGDLEVFLHCGIAPGEEKKYDFNIFFPGVKDRDITVPLLSECCSIANALDWLHNQIKIETSSNTVFCAHMDLKPANILIQPDAGSLVGKWMISDFGISVFKEETQQPDPEYGSIGDYVSQVTMNTRPKRQEGTYQAPEVKLAESAFSQSSHLTPEQRGIGRKSDIWSFGCILSEVLAFSLGKDDLVRKFQIERKRNARDDYFYTEKAPQSKQYLGAAGQSGESPKQYEIRPAVLSWLGFLCQSAASPQKWVDCYVGTIRKILVVDTVQRPDAIELLKLMRHVKEHVVNSRGSSVITCPILNPKEEKAIPIGPRAQEDQPIGPSLVQAQRITRKPVSPAKPVVASRSSRNPIPTVLRSSTFEQEVIHENGDYKISPEDKNPFQLQDQESQISSASGSTMPHNPTEPRDDDANPRPSPHPVQDVSSEPDRDSKTGSGTGSSLVSFVKPTHAHGVMVDPAVRLAPKLPTSVESVQLPKIKGSRLKITSMALTRSSDGARFACLANSSVYIYSLSTEGLSVVLDREIPLREIPLTSDSGWTGIAAADNFIAAWGYSSSDSAKVLHFCDIREPQRSRYSSPQEIALLEKVAVSEQGIAALIFAGKILVVTLDTQKAPVTLTPSLGDQKFTHAAFNDNGNLLFAWAYGQKDTLYIWRCQDRVVNQATESESRYETEKKGNPQLTRVIPYNSYQGCIIARPDKRFFPAQIHSSFRGKNKTLPRNNEIPLFNLHSACVFNDHSMITVEKGTVHRYLKEYKINYKSTHLFTLPGAEICRLKSSTKPTSQMLSVKKEENVIVIIICNMNATIEFVKVMPVIHG